MTADTHTDPKSRADENYDRRITELRDRLIAYRKAQDISHPELAKRMDVGRGRAIGAETCDPRQLRVHTLLNYMDALGLEVVLDFKPKS